MILCNIIKSKFAFLNLINRNKVFNWNFEISFLLMHCEISILAFDLIHFCPVFVETRSRSKRGQESCWRTGQKVLRGEKQERWAPEWKKVRRQSPPCFCPYIFIIKLAELWTLVLLDISVNQRPQYQTPLLELGDIIARIFDSFIKHCNNMTNNTLNIIFDQLSSHGNLLIMW